MVGRRRASCSSTADLYRWDRVPTDGGGANNVLLRDSQYVDTKSDPFCCGIGMAFANGKTRVGCKRLRCIADIVDTFAAGADEDEEGGADADGSATAPATDATVGAVVAVSDSGGAVVVVSETAGASAAAATATAGAVVADPVVVASVVVVVDAVVGASVGSSVVSTGSVGAYVVSAGNVTGESVDVVTSIGDCAAGNVCTGATVVVVVVVVVTSADDTSLAATVVVDVVSSVASLSCNNEEWRGRGSSFTARTTTEMAAGSNALTRPVIGSGK